MRNLGFAADVEFLQFKGYCNIPPLIVTRQHQDRFQTFALHQTLQARHSLLILLIDNQQKNQQEP